MLIYQQRFCSKCPKPRQVYLYVAFLNTNVMQSERRVSSSSSQKVVCQTSHPFVRCRCFFCMSAWKIITRNFVRDDFVSRSGSQEQRRSPEALTRVTFISLPGFKGPLQRRPVCFSVSLMYRINGPHSGSITSAKGSIPVCHTQLISYACPTFVRFHYFYISMASTLFFFSNSTCHLIIRHIFEMKCAAFTKANRFLKHLTYLLSLLAFIVIVLLNASVLFRQPSSGHIKTTVLWGN